MGKYTLVHRRDGEVFEKIELKPEMFRHLKNGKIVITIPPSCITLVTEDELEFDPAIKELM